MNAATMLYHHGGGLIPPVTGVGQEHRYITGKAEGTPLPGRDRLRLAGIGVSAPLEQPRDGSDAWYTHPRR
jgi:hypothetical protein